MLFRSIEDLMTRYKRMQGYGALWLPGADHAGFETQVVYEKKLEKEGRSRFGMNPKQLYEEILAFTLENKKNMEEIELFGPELHHLPFQCDPAVRGVQIHGPAVNHLAIGVGGLAFP